MENLPETMRALVLLEDRYSGKSEGPAIYGPPRRKGLHAGCEGCGDVVSAREGVQALLGKRVAFAVSLGGSGAWAEYALMDTVACIPLWPDGSDVDGSAQIVNPRTAMAMVDIAAANDDAVEPLKTLGATKVLVTTATDFVAQFAATSRALKPRVFLDAVSEVIEGLASATKITDGKVIIIP